MCGLYARSMLRAHHSCKAGCSGILMYVSTVGVCWHLARQHDTQLKAFTATRPCRCTKLTIANAQLHQTCSFKQPFKKPTVPAIPSARPATPQLRFNKVSELIHNSTNHRALERACVTVNFQEIIDKVSSDARYAVPPTARVNHHKDLEWDAALWICWAWSARRLCLMRPARIGAKLMSA